MDHLETLDDKLDQAAGLVQLLIRAAAMPLEQDILVSALFNLADTLDTARKALDTEMAMA